VAVMLCDRATVLARSDRTPLRRVAAKPNVTGKSISPTAISH
jgi:hypothetical protein